MLLKVLFLKEDQVSTNSLPGIQLFVRGMGKQDKVITGA